LIFYDYWRSSSGWRVRIALNLKQIPVDRRAVNLAPDGGAQHGAEFRGLNPMSQVPVLVLDEPGPPRTLSQSMAILEYLEERFPAPPLLPADPWLRARARQLAEMVNAGIQPMQNLSFLQRLQESGLAEPKELARHHIARGLGAIEAVAGETAGTFLVGHVPTIADLYLIPQLYSGRRFDVDLSAFPKLLQVEAACTALPAFEAAHPDAQPDAPAASKS
jgi:maleylacetoacetate isomerase